MKTQITLEQAELDSAIRSFIEARGFPLNGMTMDINIVNGRGANGTYATVDIVPASKVNPDVVETQTATEETPVEPVEEVEAYDPPFSMDEEPELADAEEVDENRSLFGNK